MLTRRQMLGGSPGALGLVFAGLIPGDATGGASAAYARHPTGFSVAVPEGFEVMRSDLGLELVEAGAIRSPRRIRITAGPARDDGIVPDDWPDGTRLTRFGEALFKRGQRPGGSGGDVWWFMIHATAGYLDLLLQAEQQSELGRPDFEYLWDVFDSIWVD